MKAIPSRVHWSVSSSLLIAMALPVACGGGGEGEDVSRRSDPMCDGADSYTDENGEDVICVYTDEPGEPWDPCWSFPQLCYPPDPTDPCELNPDSCSSSDSSGGGTEPLPLCDSVDEIPADFQAQVNQKVDSCFTQNWSTLGFVEGNSSTYTPSSGGYFYSVVDWLYNNVTSCAVQNIDWVFYGGSAGSQVMQNLVNRLNQQAQQQNLTPHQKICSAMCVSSRLITYSTANLYNQLPSNAVQSGVGVCREFAQIGERLLDGMGFSSSTVGSSANQHAFVDVTSPEGGSFYVEPQGGKCVFYNRH